MDDVIHLDFEDPSKERKRERDRTRQRDKRAAAKAEARAIPVLPKSEIPIEEIRGNPTLRSRACVNLRIERVPWPEVVRMLEYESVEKARADFLRQMAGMHQPEEAETMRLLTVANLEQLLRRSMAMAGADYLVDAEDPSRKIPNTERLRWHEQAGRDLNLLATITGVRAPLKVEVTPSEEQYALLTQVILESRGVEQYHEPDVLELDTLPAVIED